MKILKKIKNPFTSEVIVKLDENLTKSILPEGVYNKMIPESDMYSFKELSSGIYSDVNSEKFKERSSAIFEFEDLLEKYGENFILSNKLSISLAENIAFIYPVEQTKLPVTLGDFFQISKIPYSKQSSYDKEFKFNMSYFRNYLDPNIDITKEFKILKRGFYKKYKMNEELSSLKHMSNECKKLLRKQRAKSKNKLKVVNNIENVLLNEAIDISQFVEKLSYGMFSKLVYNKKYKSVIEFSKQINSLLLNFFENSKIEYNRLGNLFLINSNKENIKIYFRLEESFYRKTKYITDLKIVYKNITLMNIDIFDPEYLFLTQGLNFLFNKL